MNSTNFVSEFRRQVIIASDALDAAENKIDQFTDLGAEVTLDPHFNNVAVVPTDPLSKADIVAAGAVLIELFAFLGSGPGSRREKLNKLR